MENERKLSSLHLFFAMRTKEKNNLDLIRLISAVQRKFSWASIIRFEI